MSIARRIVSTLIVLAAPGVGLAACGGSTGSPGNASDAAFVLHMLPHHQRAIEVGELAETRGSDAQVRAFGERIVREQTPEEQHLAGWVKTLHLLPSADNAMSATGYITDAELARLRTESGVVFDRDFLLLSARSEEGAVAMSHPELANGKYAPARQLATSISGAPKSEIPQLQALAAGFPQS